MCTVTQQQQQMVTCHYRGMFFVFVLVAWCLATSVSAVIVESGGAYGDINVEIDTELAVGNVEKCQQLLRNLELTLTEASSQLSIALQGRLRFGRFNVLLPPEWEDSCIPSSPDQGNGSPSPRSSQPFRGGASDVTISPPHRLYEDRMWTLQHAGCGHPGLQINVPHQRLGTADSGREFVREWAKYRYGVFDELGHEHNEVNPPCYYEAPGEQELPRWELTGCVDRMERPDDEEEFSKSCRARRLLSNWASLVSPLAQSSLMSAPVGRFCDASTHNRYAPTRHNYLCDRLSLLEVIEQHPDFKAAPPRNDSRSLLTRPSFDYQRRVRTRYVLIVEDTLDMASREAWNFLRSAFRKWILYDLMPQNEVGLVLANGHSVEKHLPPVALQNATNRDLVASFLPYTPSDEAQPTCMSCALTQAQRMLAQRRLRYGPASEVIVLIAPGVESSAREDVAFALSQLKAVNVHITSINYPLVLNARQPLDSLTEAVHARLYSVYEAKYNSERSYLQTYVQLCAVLRDIARFYCEGEPQAPLEIHRHSIFDHTNESASGASPHTPHRNTRLASGQFYLEPGMGSPAGFYIFTHSADQPLIQSLRLVAPSGRSYSTRSDQRMAVKQLTVPSTLNETGLWRYEIERYVGNPQPHVVQVLATPRRPQEAINMEAWVEKRPEGYVTLYCALRRGRYAVVKAAVSATLTSLGPGSEQHFDLFDEGDGVPDLAHGDGIYSRQLLLEAVAAGNSVIQMEFEARNRGRDTFSVQEEEAATRETGPFERHTPLMTIYVTPPTNDSSSGDLITKHLPRILDLRVHSSDDLLLFSWSAYDKWLVDSQAPLQYELRYGASMRDLIDRINEMPLLATIDASDTNDRASDYVHNLTQTPLLYDAMWSFALRPLLRSKSLRVSNIAQVYVPPRPQPTTMRPVSTAAMPMPMSTPQPSFGDGDSDDFVTSLVTPLTGYQQLQRYLLPVGIALLLLLLVGCGICCFLTRWRRRSGAHDSSVEHSKMQEAAAVSPAEHRFDNSPSGGGGSGGVESVHFSAPGPNYGLLNESLLPDHHTVGIPIYGDEPCHKTRLSLNGSLAPTPTPTLQQIGDGVHTISGTSYYAPYGLPQAHYGCDSWSAMQQDKSVPPVPPLPASMPEHDYALYTQQQAHHPHHHPPHHYDHQHQQPIYPDSYGAPPPPPPTYSTIAHSHHDHEPSHEGYHEAPSMILSASTTTIMTTPGIDVTEGSGYEQDRRRRNITMV